MTDNVAFAGMTVGEVIWFVTPVFTGVQGAGRRWIPAFAGMTDNIAFAGMTITLCAGMTDNVAFAGMTDGF